MDFGAPLDINGEKYTDISDRYVDQVNHVTNYQKQIRAKVKEVREFTYSVIRPEIYSEPLRNEEFNDLIFGDITYAILSVALVLFYFMIHLWSIFLALMAMLLILFSFGVTAVISEGIFQVTYFSGLNGLILFIVLGIAADDFFVFNDAWR